MHINQAASLKALFATISSDINRLEEPFEDLVY